MIWFTCLTSIILFVIMWIIFRTSLTFNRTRIPIWSIGWTYCHSIGYFLYTLIAFNIINLINQTHYYLAFSSSLVIKIAGTTIYLCILTYFCSSVIKLILETFWDTYRECNIKYQALCTNYGLTYFWCLV